MKLTAHHREVAMGRTCKGPTTAFGPLLSVVRAAGSGFADSVLPIPIHYVDDPTPGWDGTSRGIAKRRCLRQSRARVPGVVNKNSLNGARRPSAALLAPMHARFGRVPRSALGRKQTAKR